MATAAGETDEWYVCRFDECDRTFDSLAGRSTHEGMVHDRRQRMLEDLRAFGTELGRAPTRREISAHDEYASHETYIQYFGSWNEAVRQAGLEPRANGINVGCEPTDEDRLYGYGPQWATKRARALDRDDGICRVCGSDGSEYDVANCVHHITPRRVYYHDPGYEWDEVNDLSNLVTLCASCHAKLEGKFQDMDPGRFAECGRAALQADECDLSVDRRMVDSLTLEAKVDVDWASMLTNADLEVRCNVCNHTSSKASCGTLEWMLYHTLEYDHEDITVEVVQYPDIEEIETEITVGPVADSETDNE